MCIFCFKRKLLKHNLIEMSSVPSTPKTPASSPSQEEKDLIDAIKAVHDLQQILASIIVAHEPPSPQQLLAILQDVKSTAGAIEDLQPMAHRAAQFGEHVINFFQGLFKRKIHA